MSPPPPSSLSLSAQEKISTLLRTQVEEKNVPPFFASVLTADSELFSTSFGKDKNGEDINKDTVLRIFSMSKLITSLAILQLIDQGHLTLDTEAGTILPGLVAPEILTGFSAEGNPVFVPAKNKVTIRHLLNHSSGLSLDKNSPDLKRYNSEKDWTNITKEERHFNQPLIHEPGTNFIYSPATDYLGRIVEILSKQTLEEYLQNNILGPLSLTSTSFILTPALKARATFTIASRDYKTNALLPSIPLDSPFAYVNTLPDTPSIFFGAWGLWSTFADYALLLQHLLQIASSSTTEPKVMRIISEESWKSLFVGTLTKEAKVGLTFARGERIPKPEVDWSTALMVNEVDWEGRRKAGSGAWQGLAHTYFLLDPTTGVALLAGTQLLPGNDSAPFDVWTKIELAAYAGLE